MPISAPLDLAIHDESTLGEAACLLHDAVFSPSSWSHDEGNRCFHLRLWRLVPGEYKREKVFLCIHRVSFKRAACDLTIRRVTRASLHVRDRLDHYSLFGIRYIRDRDLLVFDTEGAVNLEISIERLDCRLSDTGETTWRQFGYSFLGIGIGGHKPLKGILIL